MLLPFSLNSKSTNVIFRPCNLFNNHCSLSITASCLYFSDRCCEYFFTVAGLYFTSIILKISHVFVILLASSLRPISCNTSISVLKVTGSLPFPLSHCQKMCMLAVTVYFLTISSTIFMFSIPKSWTPNSALWLIPISLAMFIHSMYPSLSMGNASRVLSSSVISTNCFTFLTWGVRLPRSRAVSSSPDPSWLSYLLTGWTKLGHDNAHKHVSTKTALLKDGERSHCRTIFMCGSTQTWNH